MPSKKKFFSYLSEAKQKEVSFFELLQEKNESRYAWYVFVNSDLELSKEIKEYEDYLRGVRNNNAKVAIEKNLLLAINSLVVPKKIKLKKIVKKSIYVYPKDQHGEPDYSQTPVKAIISEDETIQEKYIAPREGIVMRAIERLFSESTNSTGIIKSIIETVKALHTNNISADTFVNIINSMPLADETKQAIISDNLASLHHSEPTFTGWGESELSKQLSIDLAEITDDQV